MKDSLRTPLTVDIIVAAYNEEESIVSAIASIREVLSATSLQWHLIIVDDGSTDRTPEIVQQMLDRNMTLVRLDRNYGHQAALYWGFRVSSAMFVVTLDADGQHPAHLIPDMVDVAASGAVDVVYMVRSDEKTRKLTKRWASKGFYWLMKQIARVDIVPGQADFRLISRRVVDEILPKGDRAVPRVAVPLLGFPYHRMEYDERSRTAGESKYSWRKMLSLSINAVASSSSLPLRLAAHAAMISGVITTGLVALIVATFISGKTVPGWASTLVAILVSSSVILGLLSVQSRYLADISDSIDRRPRSRLLFVESGAPASTNRSQTRRTPSLDDEYNDPTLRS